MAQIFDEDDTVLMNLIADGIITRVPEIFPKRIIHKTKGPVTLICNAIHRVSKSQSASFLDLIASTLDRFYLKLQGPDWKRHKKREMLEPGLVYVWYELEDGSLSSFVSFKLSFDESVKAMVLYLYEIHVDPSYQGGGFGSKMMSSFHSLGKSLLDAPSQSSPDAIPLAASYFFEQLKGTSLTVFSENSKALLWYEKLGYNQSPGSPRDRTLRSGREVKPEYYLLTRFIE